MQQICAGLILLTAIPAWAQGAPAAPGSTVGSDDSESGGQGSDSRMQTPPPVSGMAYSTDFTSEERSNYLRGGIMFSGAYSDNAFDDVNGYLQSDVSYTVLPNVAWDETTPRLHWLLNYAPGFTFYQRESSRNEADQNASLSLQYRLSPHVTLSASDGFQKSSDVFNQLDPGAVTVTGGTQGANFSVIAPISDRLSNSGNVGISYQFERDTMIGASGTFTNLHYPNASQVPGLFDSASQAGSVYASLRASKVNYLGVTYQYQRLLSYPTEGVNETQTHAVLLFYTVAPSAHFSISVFGGPQYSETTAPASTVPPVSPATDARAWTPAVGASMGWRARLTSAALSYTHVISGGAGLSGAVHMDSESAVVRQRIVPNLTAGLSGAYTNNQVLSGSLPVTNNGHTIQGNATLQQQFGEHLNVALGYTRVHQTYGGVPVISQTPNTNREFISVSYQFSRPLGR
jgi:hypothetical protein